MSAMLLSNINNDITMIMRNRLVAVSLAIGGGAFVLHEYYLGTRKGFPVIVLLHFIGLGIIPIIKGLVDGCRLLAMTQEEFDNKYNNGRCSDLVTVLSDINISADSRSSSNSAAPEKDELPEF